MHDDGDGFAVVDVRGSQEDAAAPEAAAADGDSEPGGDDAGTAAPATADLVDLDEPADTETGRPTATVSPSELQPGDRIRFVRSSDAVRRVQGRNGTYLTQSEARAWEATIPAGYQPGQPVRLQDVVETVGDQPARYLPDTNMIRLPDQVDRLGTDDAAASEGQAEQLRTSREEARAANQSEAQERRRTMLEEAGGPALVEAVTSFDEIADAAENGQAPVSDLEDAWMRADAALAAAQDGDLDWIRAAQLKTLRETLADRLVMAGGDPRAARRRAADWERAREEAERAAVDGIPEQAAVGDIEPGDRIDTPDGQTATVEEVTRAGDLTFTTERDSEDRRTIRARPDGEQVTKRTRARKQPEIGQTTAGDVAVGEWLIDDDGNASKVVGVERDGDRIVFDVLDPDGQPSLVEADAGETVTRGRGLRKKRKRAPKPPGERKPRSTIVSLPDGTPPPEYGCGPTSASGSWPWPSTRTRTPARRRGRRQRGCGPVSPSRPSRCALSASVCGSSPPRVCLRCSSGRWSGLPPGWTPPTRAWPGIRRRRTSRTATGSRRPTRKTSSRATWWPSPTRRAARCGRSGSSRRSRSRGCRSSA
ncbi:hypothetical protein [Nonomuraea recticatena]|uniref:hypothetical protein n=1 Tax=Nonomuraea recticatena TaxID=46178 RepID=UPI00361E81A0